MRWSRIARNLTTTTSDSSAQILARSSRKDGLLFDLATRGFIKDVTNGPLLDAHLSARSRTIYCGIDPTATNLHLGHLFPIMCLNHFIHAGHRVIPIIGGATGVVGDPSGRTTSRDPSDLGKVHDNVAKLTANVERCYQSVRTFVQKRVGLPQTGLTSDFKILNNHSWFSKVSLLDFLQLVGTTSKVNVMLTRDSVRSRLDSQSGLFFSEFTYQLLQAYDFYHLFVTEGCTIQIGGADQWGNIVEGLNLISRLAPRPEPLLNPDEPVPQQAFGLTTPLLTTSDGQKFGKSAGNAIWLDPHLTPILDFYQYFLRLTDEDAIKYLGLLTFIPLQQREELISDQMKNPSSRPIQKCLASEVTEMIHGESAVNAVKLLTRIMWENHPLEGIPMPKLMEALNSGTDIIKLNAAELFDTPLIKLLARHKVLKSVSQARQLMTSRAIRVNGRVTAEMNYILSPAALHESTLALVKVGANKHCAFILETEL